MSADLTKTLGDVGLSANQSAVYLACLGLGPERPTEIARRAGIKRSTVYPVLESLQALGLISTQPKGFKKLYLAENPERLMILVDERRNRLKEAVSDLTALYNLKPRESAVKYHEGLAAIKGVYKSLLKEVGPEDDYQVYSSSQDWFELDPEFFESFNEQRGALNLNVNALLADCQMAREYQANPKKYGITVKTFESSSSFKTNIVIVPSQIIIHYLGTPTWAMVLRNRHIAQALGDLFKSAWDRID